MRFRELLQIELWSKETSRKILTPVGKLLKFVAIVWGVLVVLTGIVAVIEVYWLTSGEREAGKAALAQIDELQGFVAVGGGDFEAMDRRANDSVEEAARAAWTIRDNQAAFDLWEYLSSTEGGRRWAAMRERYPDLSGGALEMLKRAEAQEAQTALANRSAALKALQ